ncbi:hypothetical protein [Compostimonas suwonensis]|uniref:Uncharacterized protein n=1 Tax=Compostimonas suwonensis TaxID=1048394 RepID=A0A2M9C0G3_9MICO|nr:hypothetical protein [Compostimonas suwonensis]PJJ63805.1 hypothetical protein CLV54_1481 [Compostimonas suwonensis]
MNSTNRVANRLLIVVCGLLLLIVGAAAAAVALVPMIRDGWDDIRGPVREQVAAWLQQTPLGDTGISWIMPAVLGLLAIGVIVLIVFIARQGRGHTRIAISEPTGEHGSTVVDAAVAEHAVQDSLTAHPEFVSSHVSTYRVRHTVVLKVSVTCRRGVSPKDAAALVESTLSALDELLGRELPALIQISGGFRSRATRATRLQ